MICSTSCQRSGRPGAAMFSLILAIVAGCADAAGPAPGAAPVASVQVAPYGGVHTGVLVVGDTVRLEATARSAAGTIQTGRTASWASSNTAIATVSNAGVVTARAAGQATIRATVEGRPGEAIVQVVTSATVQSVTLVTVSGSHRDTLFVGDTIRLLAVPRTATGEVSADRPSQWLSDDAAVATVDGTGLVTARAVGTASIEASVDGRAASRFYTVAPRGVAEVRVAPTALLIEIGGNRVLSARAFDAQGVEIHGRPVVWSSSTPTVASVTQGGAVSALAAGYADIRATVDGRTGVATVTVPSPEPVFYVFVSPSSASVWTGGSTQLRAPTAGAGGGDLPDRVVTWQSENPAISWVWVLDPQ
jgi:trimeric autotransporter adhesin